MRHSERRRSCARRRLGRWVGMRKIVFLKNVRRPARAVWPGLAAAAVAIQSGHAQSPAAYSALFGQSNLTGLPGQNVAQQKMGQSINNFCPTVSTIAMPTPDQRDLGALCSAMIG